MGKSVILYIDTADSKRASVKLELGRNVVSELVEEQRTKSQVLLPLIDKLLKSCDAKLSDLTEILVNPGPGSFTGLRVGLSVANTLGWTLGITVNGKDVLSEPIDPVYS